MPRPKPACASSGGWLAGWGWDLMLGSIAVFYAVMAPYTKVEESFNVQAMHDILYHTYHIKKYDHLEFPGVVPRTFIGAFAISILSSPAVFVMRLLHVPKFYSLLTVRLLLSCVTLLSLRLLRVQIVAAVVFRCDIILLLGPIGLALLLNRSVSLLEAVKYCVSTALICIALPRSMLVAYPLCMAGVLLDRRIVPYILPVFLFVVLYSKLPHKELRFIIGSIPMFNVSASLAASRLYNNRKKAGWNLLYILMLGAFLVSLGYSAVTFVASYNNYPGGYALKALHEADSSVKEKMVHIDAFTAMRGVSRFCENEYPWRYSKEEEISIEEFQERNFTYLLNEHHSISGYKCLFAVDGFSRVKLQPQIPPLSLVKEPKVFAHGNMRDPDILSLNWPGCP
ncbi:Dol-P-Man:Man(7)GlcNAc(2)-PP-Dol alpha-1,6-mannosyltransferase [Dichanthelium oligosanthes]|uniref:Mannosyltransferase n=1 Tax=Dichanthelium oligosanthes TaxID=888268 RepID=A0A1E5V1U6_9POAL|nr:Dol-P-Man:Man(7)GlcNAc(2)-PP-Dol alpha-1,6-mannosyltransferase [Dichanthelium oligosanthes]